MYEFLKKLFGDGAITFDQFVEALNGDKSIKLVNLSDGGYVSKEKFTAKETELSGVKQQLEEANATIQSYKDMDIDGIKESAATWEQKYKDDTAALNKKLQDQQTEFAARTYLGSFQFSDDLVKEAVYAKFMSKNFTFKDGKFEGADAFMADLKKSYPTSFKAEADPTGGDGNGAGNGSGTGSGSGSGSGSPSGNPTGNQNGGNPNGNRRPWFAPPKGPSFAGGPKRTLSEMMTYKNQHPEAKIDFE